jgi:hypothetical protein
MKKSNLKFIFVAIGIAIGVTAVSVYSCEKQEFTPNTAEAVSDDPTRFITEPGAVCGDMIEKRVITQNNKHIANALIYNDTKYFYVILTPTKGFYLVDTYLEMADKIGEIPLDENGSIVYTDFEYSITGKSPSTMRKFRIPLNEFNGYSFGSVAVEVSNNPNRPVPKIVGFVDGKFIGGEVAGRIFPYTKELCLTDNAKSNEDVQ